ncbi:Leukocidin/Hemolysin toxin family protein [Thermoactinomyces sp. DSM 45891]|uniref:leukocidin family pore-forming toxin n=1 Tax=Thermoactinomyces sp. DSM 45891 TaxID=1761907 RepID=UPI00091AFB2E|nr:leukocidin family pore-forming toxin [Thermoactinomyces sp. DSM 45891]SFX65027.1 Leukocidin/Hemolysin toxin family protein [Thermoactinomyces sp. DSM 45891]
MTSYFDFPTLGPNGSDNVKTWIDTFQHSGGQYEPLTGIIANDHAPNASGTLHMSLEAIFIEDHRKNQSYLALKTGGSMEALAWQAEINDNTAFLAWASEYHTQIFTGQDVTIFRAYPQVRTEEVIVTDNIGYTLREGFQDGFPNINQSKNWNTSISYDQKFYRTEMNHHDTTNVGWVVSLNKYGHSYDRTEFDRDRSSGAFGNQLFMKETTTLSGTAYENLDKKDEIRGLPANLFSPHMMSIIISDKAKPYYDVTVKYLKYVDMYELVRTSIGVGYKYTGRNFKNIGVVQYNQTFKVDWKNHKLIPQEQNLHLGHERKGNSVQII